MVSLAKAFYGREPIHRYMVGGSLQAIFAPLLESLPHINSGAIKALGVCGVRRSPLVPNAPLISDVLPGYLSTSWTGLFAPVKTPVDIVNKMYQAHVKVLSVPNVKAHFTESDKEAVGNTPAEFKQFVAVEAERLRTQVKISGARAE